MIYGVTYRVYTDTSPPRRIATADRQATATRSAEKHDGPTVVVRVGRLGRRSLVNGTTLPDLESEARWRRQVRIWRARWLGGLSIGSAIGLYAVAWLAALFPDCERLLVSDIDSTPLPLAPTAVCEASYGGTVTVTQDMLLVIPVALLVVGVVLRLAARLIQSP